LYLLLSLRCFALSSEDAYITSQGTTWTLGTVSVERVIALESDRLVNKSFRSKINGRELAAIDSSGPWTYINARTSKLEQGELQLDLTLRQGALAVTRSYVVYPGSSVIRERAVLKNVGSAALQVTDPEFLHAAIHLGGPQSLDFHWMTGAQNQPGSWALRTEKLSPRAARTFDSYDAFPGEGQCYRPTDDFDPPGSLDPGILFNGRRVWPTAGWLYPNTAAAVPFDIDVAVKKGDELAFLMHTAGNRGWLNQTAAFDPTIAYEDGEQHTASKEFSNIQGHYGWRYQYQGKGQSADLVYDAHVRQWRRANSDSNGLTFVGAGEQRADHDHDAVRVWTAPRAGKVSIKGSVCATGDRAGSGGVPGPNPGSSNYAPWIALQDLTAGDGVFIGWDYFGHWASSYRVDAEGVVTAGLRVTGHRQTLAPGESLTTPWAFIGVFQGELDNAGNELLDWQYRYLWDYTREVWFPDIRSLGAWWKGARWDTRTAEGAQTTDFKSLWLKAFRMADWMRYTGVSVYHLDRDWYDRMGDWHSADFREPVDYLRKSVMGQMFLMPFEANVHSKIARDDPEWILPGGAELRVLDMSQPGAINFVDTTLDSLVAQWGNFSWRNDDLMLGRPTGGDDTTLLRQDEGVREALRRFLDRHPLSSFQACNSGGNYAGYDYTRYASSLQISDGAVALRNYWAALLLPPDKSTIPQNWDVERYNKADWRAHLSSTFAMQGDTWKPEKMEGIRELVDIYQYLYNKGVAGRWVHVYRPIVTGDDPTAYFQRLSRDAKRGIIILRRAPAPGAITIKPKGLLPSEPYFVSFQESDRIEQRIGAELMDSGIKVKEMPSGELIYLNLPMHPGSKLDTVSPEPPSTVSKRRGENMGYPGIELEWTPGTDNNWISYYEIIRNGIAIDKVARGRFYFDHSAGADLAAVYEVRSVDGAGNSSARVAALGLQAKASHVVDDGANGEIAYSPGWKHDTEEPLVAYDGTISSVSEKGATAALTFTGKRVLWLTKLGAENGKAGVSIDGGPPEIVDTYAADDIWGVVAYRHEFATVGRHTIRIEVLGEHDSHPNERSRDTVVYLDGIRIEME